MIQRLNPWQRFWGMFALVSLVSTIVLIVAVWPAPDAAIVADLHAPACQQWRDMPDTGGPNYFPEPGEPCRAMRLFRYEQHFTLHSEDDYTAFLLRAGVRKALYGLAWWAGFLGLLYVSGVYAKKVVDAMPKRDRRKAG